MNAEAPSKPQILTLSQARHQFNNLPKHFDANPDTPILIDHQGHLTMAVISFGQLMELTRLQRFIEDKQLSAELSEWLEQQRHHHVHDEHCNHDH